MRWMVMLLAAVATAAQARLPDCWPSQIGGTGTKAIVGSTVNGSYLAWWCPTLASWRYEYTLRLPGAASTVTPPPVPATNLQGWAAQMWTTYVTQDSMGEAYDLLWNDLVEPLKAIRPLDPVWKVAINSTYPTRPAYTVVNGALVTSTQRAAVGALCDCRALALQVGERVYCQPNPLIGVVSLCRKQ